MATKKADKTKVWPKVEKGNHLTVYTYEDGSTKLEWDDKALLKEVHEATKDYVKPLIRAKRDKKVPTNTVAKKTVAKKATKKVSKTK